MALKAEYRNITGEDFPVAGRGSSKPKDSKPKDAAPKEKVAKQKPAQKEKKSVEVTFFSCFSSNICCYFLGGRKRTKETNQIRLRS